MGNRRLYCSLKWRNFLSTSFWLAILLLTLLLWPSWNRAWLWFQSILCKEKVPFYSEWVWQNFIIDWWYIHSQTVCLWVLSCNSSDLWWWSTCKDQQGGNVISWLPFRLTFMTNLWSCFMPCVFCFRWRMTRYILSGHSFRSYTHTWRSKLKILIAWIKDLQRWWHCKHVRTILLNRKAPS